MAALSCVGVIVIATLFAVLGSIIQGWVLSIMWGWFVMPIFNVPALGIPMAIGFSLVVALLTHQTNTKSNEKKSGVENIAELIGVIFGSLFILLVGWIVHMFV